MNKYKDIDFEKNIIKILNKFSYGIINQIKKDYKKIWYNERSGVNL